MRVRLAMLAAVLTVCFVGPSTAMVAILDGSASEGGALVHAVKPGDAFDIVGNCLTMAQASHDVRVVLSLADTPAASNVGYRSVLATEQRLSRDALHVRVPEIPDMENHVYHVRVYALGIAAPGICDAGQIHIG